MQIGTIIKITSNMFHIYKHIKPGDLAMITHKGELTEIVIVSGEAKGKCDDLGFYSYEVVGYNHLLKLVRF